MNARLIRVVLLPGFDVMGTHEVFEVGTADVYLAPELGSLQECDVKLLDGISILSF